MIACVVSGLFTGGASRAAAAELLPRGFADETVVEGLELPTAIDFTADGRLFIAEKSGVIRVAVNGVLMAEPFIDLRDEVNNGFEYGLLGLAVDPQFPVRPYVYVQYVYDPPGVTQDDHAPRVQRIERITANADDPIVASQAPGSRVVLVGRNSDLSALPDPSASPGSYSRTCWRDAAPIPDCIPADSYRHVGGGLDFGPDGALYATVGDVDRDPDGPQTPGQFVGSVLRVDPNTGRGLSSNPFYDGNPDSNLSKVYAYGLRNPFRIAVHPETGEIFAGDVGAGTWEEIDRIERGLNYGWPCREGPEAYGEFADDPICAGVVPAEPVYAWAHEDAGGAAVAGDWYRGSEFPPEYQGAFFFGDYSAQFLRYLLPDGAGGYTVHDFASGMGANALVSLKSGPDGALYWVDLVRGQVRRIRYAADAGGELHAHASVSPQRGSVPFEAQFDATDPTVAQDEVARYDWDFGDGATGEGIAPRHTYSQVGTFRVTLTVTDYSGRHDTTELVVEAGNGPELHIDWPGDRSTAHVGDTVGFGAHAQSETGDDMSDQILWTAVLHHNVHIHPNLISPITGRGGSLVLADHGDNTHVELCAQATGPSGFTTKQCIDIVPETVETTLESDPPGLLLTYAEWSARAPATFESNRGGTRTVTAPKLADRCYEFDGWSDGGARSHTIVTNDDTWLSAHFHYVCQPITDPDYRPLTPVRVLETRAAAGLIGYSGDKPGPGAVVELALPEVPRTASAVALNLTGADATNSGFLTVWPCGQPRPATSSVNLAEAQAGANLVISKLGVGGRVCIYTEAGAHLIADLVGYYPNTTTYAARQPVRVLETRKAARQIGYAGDRPAAGATIVLKIGQLPPGANAAVVNLTATDAAGGGYVTAWPCGQPRPLASSLNLQVGRTTANLVVSRLGPDNSVCIYTDQSTHLVADLVGSFVSSSYTARQPVRILETRPGARVAYDGPKPQPGQVIALAVPDAPASAIAVAINLTGTDADGDGYVTLWPCGEPRPLASTLNVHAGTAVPNLVVTKLGAGGRVCIYTEVGVHLIADLEGWFDHAPPVPGLPDDYVEPA